MRIATQYGPQTHSADRSDAGLRQALSDLLDAVRARTLLLLEGLDDSDARIQHDPLMSPIVWDLGHVAAFERLWLQEQLQRDVRFGEMPGLYNPFEHPRSERGSLPLPDLRKAVEDLHRTRSATIARLSTISLDADSPLLRDGFVHRMVAQHEAQHQETILQTLQLKTGEPYTPPRQWQVPEPVAGSLLDGAMAAFPGGPVTLGTDDHTWAYDNERPRHTVFLPPFAIDVTPVTNRAYREFVEAGGYDDPRLWSGPGREWLQQSGARAPKYWRTHDGGWSERTMDLETDLDPRKPVAHVCYHEAAAFACWAGKRLPTEAEWEIAATWDPRAGTRAFPWGDDPLQRTHANVDQLAFSTARVGAYATNVSPLGCHGMIGDLWEWTSSDFTGYPGFRSFPYPEYSEAFFGSAYKVLRGGSWATSRYVARGTFRNWDYPVRRQIFSGFRCARDA